MGDNTRPWSERQELVLRAASKPNGIGIPNNRGWKAWVCDDLHSNGYLDRTSCTPKRIRYRITGKGAALLESWDEDPASTGRR